MRYKIYQVKKYILLSFSAYASIFHTQDIYSYTQVWVTVMDEDHIVFRARACSDVHVGLARYPGISNVEMYEVVLGGWENTKCAIRSSIQGESEVEVQEEGVVSCTQSRSFWISWVDGAIKAGRGANVGERTILYWQPAEPMHLINAAGFTNWDGVNGTWEIGAPDREYSVSFSNNKKTERHNNL